MTWNRRGENGLFGEVPQRSHNLPDVPVHGPELPAGERRSTGLPAPTNLTQWPALRTTLEQPGGSEDVPSAGHGAAVEASGPHDVVIERVHDRAGIPTSTVTTDGGDRGLWRVISTRHGTQLVISHAEALSIAHSLVAGSDGRVRTLHHPADTPRHERLLSGRASDHESQRTQSGRGERRSR